MSVIPEKEVDMYVQRKKIIFKVIQIVSHVIDTLQNLTRSFKLMQTACKT